MARALSGGVLHVAPLACRCKSISRPNDVARRGDARARHRASAGCDSAREWTPDRTAPRASMAPASRDAIDSMSEDFTGTGAVQERYRFDVARLEAFLAERIAGFRGPLTVTQFKGGQSNPTFLLDTPGARYVMRSKPAPAAKLLPSAHAVDREYRVITALGRTGVPVPRTYCLCEDEGLIGRAFYVMEFVDGRVLWEQALPGMTPRGARRDLRRDEPRDRARCTASTTGRSAWRLRQAGQLLRAPDRPLVEAVPRLRDRADPGDGSADRLAARRDPAGRRDGDRARRLPPRQPRSSIRPSRGSSRSSTGSSRRSATRSRTSPTTA